MLLLLVGPVYAISLNKYNIPRIFSRVLHQINNLLYQYKGAFVAFADQKDKLPDKGDMRTRASVCAYAAFFPQQIDRMSVSPFFA